MLCEYVWVSFGIWIPSPRSENIIQVLKGRKSVAMCVCVSKLKLTFTVLHISMYILKYNKMTNICINYCVVWVVMFLGIGGQVHGWCSFDYSDAWMPFHASMYFAVYVTGLVRVHLGMYAIMWMDSVCRSVFMWMYFGWVYQLWYAFITKCFCEHILYYKEG